MYDKSSNGYPAKLFTTERYSKWNDKLNASDFMPSIDHRLSFFVVHTKKQYYVLRVENKILFS